MAGIGFELKKLYQGSGGFRIIRAVSISTAVTVAPMLLTIITMLTLQWYMSNQGISFAMREQFMLHVYYAMIFSYILTSVIIQPLTRYVSDRLYDGQLDRILPSAYGSVSVFLMVGLPVSIFFILVNDTNPLYELLTVGLFHVMGAIWLEMIYLTAVRRYRHIFFGFCISACLAIPLAILLIKLGFDPVASCLTGTQAGFGVMSFLFMRIIQNEFPSNRGNNMHFFGAFAAYPQLIMSGFFMACSAFMHCLVMWISKEAVVISRLMRYTPPYDVPAFLAFITLIPLFVRFNVVVEVHFEEGYHKFYDLICNTGTYTDIKLAHQEMIEVARRELYKLAEIQGFVVLFFITIVTALVPTWLLLPTYIPIFRFLALGYYAYGMVQVIVIMLLYFDDRRGALWISGLFFLLSGGVSLALMPLGKDFYGAGFFCAGIITAIVCALRFSHYIKELEYYTFCTNSITKPRITGFPKIMSRFLYKIAKY